MHIHTIYNDTIKYESQSLVVGEAIAYKRIFKPISPCKNNWEFVCRSETNHVGYVQYQVTQRVVVASELLKKFL